MGWGKNYLKYGVAQNDILKNDVSEADLETYSKAQDKWHCMLKRCYSGDYPSYIGTFVCESWLIFSNFYKWLLNQPYWKDLELDKDIVMKGSKVYSPETCALVPSYINKSFIIRPPKPGNVHGVFKDSSSKTVKWICQCTINGMQEYFGRYHSQEEAHKVWQKIKIQNFQNILATYQGSSCFDSRVEDRIISAIHTISEDLLLEKITQTF